MVTELMAGKEGSADECAESNIIVMEYAACPLKSAGMRAQIETAITG